MVYLASRISFNNGIWSIVFAEGMLLGGGEAPRPGPSNPLAEGGGVLQVFSTSGALASCAAISKSLATTGAAENQRRQAVLIRKNDSTIQERSIVPRWI
jgi:hypothetical protein